MTQTGKKNIGVQLDAQRLQAIDKLCSASGNNISEVVRDLIDWAYWPLLSHYCGVKMLKHKPLPELKGKTE